MSVYMDDLSVENTMNAVHRHCRIGKVVRKVTLDLYRAKPSRSWGDEPWQPSGTVWYRLRQDAQHLGVLT